MDMLLKEKKSGSVSYMLLRVVWKLLEHDKKTRYYGTDQQLFEAEIHMIVTIKNNPGLHVTGLAQRLGITKGAVSQIINRLEKKGMVAKQEDQDNRSRLLLALTPKGETAFEHHRELHRQFDEIIDDILGDEPEENREAIRRFLVAVEERLDSFAPPGK